MRICSLFLCIQYTHFFRTYGDYLHGLHETVHELHRKKLNGVILKIDFEKAYDKVKWSFIQQTLRMKGFSAEWRALINSFVSGGSVAIKVNDDTGRYFQMKKAYDRVTRYRQYYLT